MNVSLTVTEAHFRHSKVSEKIPKYKKALRKLCDKMEAHATIKSSPLLGLDYVIYPDFVQGYTFTCIQMHTFTCICIYMYIYIILYNTKICV